MTGLRATDLQGGLNPFLALFKEGSGLIQGHSVKQEEGKEGQKWGELCKQGEKKIESYSCVAGHGFGTPAP